MNKINVLHVITELALGGAQRYALDVITRCDATQYNKYLISSCSGMLNEKTKQIADVKFHFLPTLNREINLLNDFITLILLIKFIRKAKIDIVHTHSSKAGMLGRWAAKIAGVKVIIHTIHGWSFNSHINNLARWLYIYLERITARWTTRLIAVSESDIKKGLDNKIGYPKKYVLIRYGVDRDEIKEAKNQARTKENLGLDAAAPVVAMIACLKKQKNPLDFIKAAAIVLKTNPGVRFISIGDGVLRRGMERLIRTERLEEKVFLLGWRQDVYKIMPILDIVVLTSLWEGLPIVILEAMACAKPIVAYNVDGVGEIVKEAENGYLVKEKDVEALADKINILLQDNALSARMGKTGYDFLAQPSFNPRHMMEQIERLYQELVRQIKDTTIQYV